ncbi:hypothetical protein [Symmachiella dynata]
MDQKKMNGFDAVVKKHHAVAAMIPLCEIAEKYDSGGLRCALECCLVGD